MRKSIERGRLPEWADIQGLVLSAYKHLDCAAYLFYSIVDEQATKRWIADVAERITPALRNQHKVSGRSLNVAFTASGLAKLCGELWHFADPFVQGMDAPPFRSRMLGDVGDNDPARWRWGGPARPVDILLMVYAGTQAVLEAEVLDSGPPLEATILVERVTARSLADMKHLEHFGFRDGISQPILAGSSESERFPESVHLTALGEFVLGYPNALGIALGDRDEYDRQAELPAMPGCPEFGRNGSYLVLRQLEQDVHGFWSTMMQQTGTSSTDSVEARRLASKIIGRAPDGTPLVPYANADDNEFGFADDPYGYGCPLGAHIRRSNPRDSLDNNNLPADVLNDHRILRRGRSYSRPSEVPGSADPELGLVFLCLNADIDRQFEFIQQNWVNNPGFSGLAAEVDPLIGNNAAVPHGTFTIASLPAPVCLRDLPRFVTVRGGQYFFLPGLRALTCLGRT
jgi:Dyp-type peroxidase family